MVTTPTPRQKQEAAKLLVEHGRWWLMPLPEHDIERASIAVVRDPHYRQEMRRNAYQRAAELNDNDLLARLIGAAEVLDG